MERYSDSLNIKILLTFLLGFTSTGLLFAAEAQENKLACLNDYVVTISCMLNISIDPLLSEGNYSYWLEFEQGDKYSHIKKFECPLVNQMDHYYCTCKSTEQFIDSEYFVIAFCSDKNVDKLCLEMDNWYMPVHHIKPIAPINLKVYWSSGQYQFIWDSGYESYIPATFMKRLKYHFQYYKRGHPESAKTIHPRNKKQHIDGFNFEPDTEYIAKVCSSPGQVRYKGQRSEWSAAVKWRTNVSQDATTSVKAVPLFIWIFPVLACMPAGMLMFLCFHPKDRCRIKSRSSIPTPVPYFQPLYSNYNGDFQSWLVSRGNLGEPFTMEEILTIETLIEATPIVNEERLLSLPSVNPYVNVSGMAEQDKLDTLPPTSIQKYGFKVFSSLSLEQTGTSGDDSGSGGPDSQPSQQLSSFEPQNMCCSEDYCTLADTHNDLILSTEMEKARDQRSSPSEVIPRAWF